MPGPYYPLRQGKKAFENYLELSRILSLIPHNAGILFQGTGLWLASFSLHLHYSQTLPPLTSISIGVFTLCVGGKHSPFMSI